MYRWTFGVVERVGGPDGDHVGYRNESGGEENVEGKEKAGGFND